MIHNITAKLQKNKTSIVSTPLMFYINHTVMRLQLYAIMYNSQKNQPFAPWRLCEKQKLNEVLYSKSAKKIFY